jgi:hypothetical protein
VAASDAFFPFRDGLDAVAEAGATAVIQPGGSVRDAEVIGALSDLGVVFLLFLAGVVLHPNRLVRLFRKASVAVVLVGAASFFAAAALTRVPAPIPDVVRREPFYDSLNSHVERYRSPESGRMTTMSFPRFSGRFAVSRAAQTAAPTGSVDAHCPTTAVAACSWAVNCEGVVEAG